MARGECATQIPNSFGNHVLQNIRAHVQRASLETNEYRTVRVGADLGSKPHIVATASAALVAHARMAVQQSQSGTLVATKHVRSSDVAMSGTASRHRRQQLALKIVMCPLKPDARHESRSALHFG